MQATRKRFQMLIADDDHGFRATLCEIFSPLFGTVEAATGAEAVEIVRSGHIDLALLDMHMPAMTGLEVATVARQWSAELPCIIITAEATDGLRESARKQRIAHVLSKPVTRRLLISTVAETMSSVYDHTLDVGLD